MTTSTCARRNAAILLIPTVLVALTACTTADTTTETTTATTTEEAVGGDLLVPELHDLLPAEIQESGRIVVGSMFDNPPLLSASIEDPAVPEGIVYDLANEIAPILGVEFEWRNSQFASLIPGLESGQIDVMWTMAAINEEREQTVLDMIGYYLTPLGMLVAAGNPSGITELNDLCGYTVGVTVGGVQAEWAKAVNIDYCVAQGRDEITIAEFQGGEETALASGAVDAVIESMSSLELKAEAEPDLYEAILIPTEESTAFDPGIIGIGVSKTKPGLSEALVGALTILMEDGRYAEIFTNWNAEMNLPPADDLAINPLTGTLVGEMA